VIFTCKRVNVESESWHQKNRSRS